MFLQSYATWVENTVYGITSHVQYVSSSIEVHAVCKTATVSCVSWEGCHCGPMKLTHMQCAGLPQW